MYRSKTVLDVSTIRKRAVEAIEKLSACNWCPRKCGVNRLADEVGRCGIGRYARVASYGAHFGEEAPLVGMRGSGTVFFGGCNLRCGFCQNADIVHNVSEQQEVISQDLASVFMQIQLLGCHNLNLVTPTHVLPQILEALPHALEQGFELPIIWNCGGYESLEGLRLLNGIVSIYMPDIKFMDSDPSTEFLHAADYPTVAKVALREMHEQVGDLFIDKGIAKTGLLVRHLIMPKGISGTTALLDYLSNELSRSTAVNIMDQYHPCHDAIGHSLIGERPGVDLIADGRKNARKRGLRLVD